MVSRHGSRMKRHRKDTYTVSTPNAGASRIFDTTKMKYMIGSSEKSPSRTARYRTPNSWKKVSKDPSRTQRCRKLLTITSKTTRRQGRTLSRQNSSKRYPKNGRDQNEGYRGGHDGCSIPSPQGRSHDRPINTLETSGATQLDESTPGIHHQ